MHRVSPPLLPEILPFRQRPRDISFPQVATCGYENPAFQAAET
jgi:hypothetical protein